MAQLKWDGLCSVSGCDGHHFVHFSHPLRTLLLPRVLACTNEAFAAALQCCRLRWGGGLQQAAVHLMGSAQRHKECRKGTAEHESRCVAVLPYDEPQRSQLGTAFALGRKSGASQTLHGLLVL